MPSPTIVSFANFKASEDGDALRDAMEGLGSDKQAIIDILTARTNAQRQEIAHYFSTQYEKDLVKELKGELLGNFENVMVALMRTPIIFSCKQLHKALKGLTTNESALVEILCTKTNSEISEIVKSYEDLYDRPLVEHLCAKTSGAFRKFLTLIVTGVRKESDKADQALAKEQAANLFAAGEAKLGTDEAVFNQILAHSSFDQLRLVFEEYKQLTGQSIKQAIKHEISGSLAKAMQATVECVLSPADFFASCLFNAMEGMGTDDSTLIRIIVSRSEIDLNDIKREFEKLYDRTLLSAVKNETSGDYQRALCALIGDA